MSEAELARRELRLCRHWHETAVYRCSIAARALDAAKWKGDGALQAEHELNEARRAVEQAGRDLSSARRVCRMLGA